MIQAPVSEAQRIESLDVLRGFALLGILLLNIVGFGLVSSAYSSPSEAMTGLADLIAWSSVELFAEGAMRGLFSILFGAGVVLFVGGAEGRGAGIHFKRNFWLLAFGLFDAYLLLWNGDILINYALAGALLYFVRDVKPGRLLATAIVLFVMLSAFYGVTNLALSTTQQAALQVEQADDVDSLDPRILEAAQQWEDFAGDFQLSAEQKAQELAARQGSYGSALAWNAKKTNEMLTFVLPLYLFWDALVMMLLGMALYKYGVLHGTRSPAFYKKLMWGGFSIGLLVNATEVYRAIDNDFALPSVFAQMQATYHIGRLGMALGYIGLLLLLINSSILTGLRARLASVGRMALTNYLMHSFIALLLFTGAGFALVGELTRAQLYAVVIAIWVLQLWLSPWWLARYRFGPVEWLWRVLTYGKLMPNRRTG
ncbi:MAG: DUF418 domain-containing protein [Pseudomonadaceae bacterium]|nr:DUF418 domain-containing protein [Pseudomonadaceae bacterium]